MIPTLVRNVIGSAANQPLASIARMTSFRLIGPHFSFRSTLSCHTSNSWHTVLRWEGKGS
jgi:hypothetical protein